MKRLMTIAMVCFLSACAKEEVTTTTTQEETKPEAPVEEVTKETPASLDDILASQSDETKDRYAFRNPKETLEFFGVKPGMTVVEALPGGGWYTKILIPYLGEEGKLVGVDYDIEMWPNFSFVKEEFMEKKKTWAEDWSKEANEWAEGANVTAHTFATLPETLSGEVDQVLFIRALHNLNRFEEKGQYLTQALNATHRILKPGGLVGVVQHEASEEKPDEWADGSRGYLKKSNLVASFEKAGFTLLKESDINSNPKDNPGEEDIVWRLPPVYLGSRDDEEKKAQFTEIGESNRMTLVFQKN